MDASNAAAIRNARSRLGSKRPQLIAELLQTSRTNIVEHIGHIYSELELDEAATCRNFRQVRIEGSRNVAREMPFLLTDGNKRSAAALFVHFLARNGALDDARGVPRITNTALAAITLMVAMSDPKEKDLMIALLVSMLGSDEQVA